MLVSRDTMICWTIASLVKHYPLDATRNPATARASAASTVKDVFDELMIEKDIDERTINNIWQRHKEQYRGYYERPRN
jgi:hypothetical protein